MDMKDFMIAANFRLGEGSEYLWDCYGPNAWFLDLALESTENSCNVIYDCTTGEIFQIDVFVGSDASRWINPAYSKAYCDESKRRGVDACIAYDHIAYTDINSEMLMLQVVADLVNNKPKEENMSCNNACPDCDCVHEDADEPPVSMMPKAETREYKVTIEMTHEMDVTASSMEEAVNLGKEFARSLVPHVSAPAGVCWMDSFVSKETVSRNLHVESIVE